LNSKKSGPAVGTNGARDRNYSRDYIGSLESVKPDLVLHFLRRPTFAAFLRAFQQFRAGIPATSRKDLDTQPKNKQEN
jgi:hypothetical protein